MVYPCTHINNKYVYIIIDPMIRNIQSQSQTQSLSQSELQSQTQLSDFTNVETHISSSAPKRRYLNYSQQQIDELAKIFEQVYPSTDCFQRRYLQCEGGHQLPQLHLKEFTQKFIATAGGYAANYNRVRLIK